MAEVADQPKFNLGRIFITPNAMSRLMGIDVERSLERHASGDWGECGSEDWRANDEALRFGGRLLSVYWGMSKERFWVISEADRSSTTILMPEDY